MSIKSFLTRTPHFLFFTLFRFQIFADNKTKTKESCSGTDNFGHGEMKIINNNYKKTLLFPLTRFIATFSLSTLICFYCLFLSKNFLNLCTKDYKMCEEADFIKMFFRVFSLVFAKHK